MPIKYKEAILETARELQLNRRFHIQDALGRFVNTFLPYARLFEELLAEVLDNLEADPLFSYALALVTHYALSIYIPPPPHIKGIFLEGDKVKAHVNPSASWDNNQAMWLVSLQVLLRSRYDLLNRLNFIEELRSAGALAELQNSLFKYVDLLPKDELITLLRLLSSNYGAEQEEILERSIPILIDRISTGKIWAYYHGKPPFSVASPPFTFCGEDVYWHPASRLLLSLEPSYTDLSVQIWQASFALQLSHLYGCDIGDKKLAYHYFVEASEIFDEIPALSGTDSATWFTLKEVLSDKVNSLVSIRATRKALEHAQEQKSQELLANLREKSRDMIGEKLLQTEDMLLGQIKETSSLLTRRPFYTSSGQAHTIGMDPRGPIRPGEKREGLEHFREGEWPAITLDWDNLMGIMNQLRNELNQLYTQIEKSYPAYVALKDINISYEQLLESLQE